VLRHIAKRFIAIPSKDNKGCSCEISTKQQPKSFIFLYDSNFGPDFPRKLFLYCHEIHIDHHCRVGFLLLSVQIPEFWASSESLRSYSLRSAKRTIKLSRCHHHRLRGCHPINNMQSGRAAILPLIRVRNPVFFFFFFFSTVLLFRSFHFLDVEVVPKWRRKSAGNRSTMGPPFIFCHFGGVFYFCFTAEDDFHFTRFRHRDVGIVP
jgi:hypothetical protein